MLTIAIVIYEAKVRSTFRSTSPSLAPWLRGLPRCRRAKLPSTSRKKNPVEISDFDRPCRAKDFLGERRKIISRRALLAEQYLIPPLSLPPLGRRPSPPKGVASEASEKIFRNVSQAKHQNEIACVVLDKIINKKK